MNPIQIEWLFPSDWGNITVRDLMDGRVVTEFTEDGSAITQSSGSSAITIEQARLHYENALPKAKRLVML